MRKYTFKTSFSNLIEYIRITHVGYIELPVFKIQKFISQFSLSNPLNLFP